MGTEHVHDLTRISALPRAYTNTVNKRAETRDLQSLFIFIIIFFFLCLFLPRDITVLPSAHRAGGLSVLG